MHRSLLLLVPLFILAGCAANFPSLTENFRSRLGEQNLANQVFHVSAPMDFHSVQLLDSVITRDGSYRRLKRILQIGRETPGRLVDQGQDWVKVDFGQGIALTFARRANDGVYATAGWGLISIAGIRYDIVVGILSGADIELRVRE
jgi:hypothetical protein